MQRDERIKNTWLKTDKQLRAEREIEEAGNAAALAAILTPPTDEELALHARLGSEGEFPCIVRGKE
jgi:hypothetical protein